MRRSSEPSSRRCVRNSLRASMGKRIQTTRPLRWANWAMQSTVPSAGNRRASSYHPLRTGSFGTSVTVNDGSGCATRTGARCSPCRETALATQNPAGVGNAGSVTAAASPAAGVLIRRSMLTGKLTGNFQKSAVSVDFRAQSASAPRGLQQNSLHNGTENFKRRNREFFAKQGVGTRFFDDRNPRRCDAIRTRVLDAPFPSAPHTRAHGVAIDHHSASTALAGVRQPKRELF